MKTTDKCVIVGFLSLVEITHNLRPVVCSVYLYFDTCQDTYSAQYGSGPLPVRARYSAAIWLRSASLPRAGMRFAMQLTSARNVNQAVRKETSMLSDRASQFAHKESSGLPVQEAREG